MGKRAVKFHLVHRSDRDPLILDENSSKLVLQEATTVQNVRRREARQAAQRRKHAEDEDGGEVLFPTARHCEETRADVSGQVSVGSGDDDDLEYVPSSGQFRSRVLLPAEALPSQYEEATGVLARDALVTGVVRHLPTDVQDALLGRFSDSDDFDELDEDFVQQAMISDEEPISDIDDDLTAYVRKQDRQYEDDDDDAWVERGRPDRPGLLGELDAAFDNLMLQYDSDEIGELDEDVVGVCANVEDTYLDEFISHAETKYVPGPNVSAEADEVISLTRHHVLRQIQEGEAYDTEEDNRALERECCPPVRESWDCESILSTLSNLENHPVLIAEPRRDRIKLTRRGLPDLEDQHPADTQTQEHEANEVNLGQSRPVKESAEQKRERKAAVRKARSERRQQKKALREAFTREEKLQHSVGIQQRLHNPSAVKL
ncbi:Protein LTV1 like protein [Plasmodiophora brassicae]